MNSQDKFKNKIQLKMEKTLKIKHLYTSDRLWIEGYGEFIEWLFRRYKIEVKGGRK